VAQGYEIKSRAVTPLRLLSAEARIVHLAASSPTRDEAVTYWLRSGADFVTSPTAAQLQTFRGRRNLDGALVRASTQGSDKALFEMQAQFLSEFAEALSPEARAVLLGTGAGDPS
jgi:EpsI family protein